MPWQEEVLGGRFVCGDGFEDGAGAEEGGVESEVVADFVAMGFEGVEAAFGVRVALGAAACGAAGPVGLGELVGAFEGVVEAAVEGRRVSVGSPKRATRPRESEGRRLSRPVEKTAGKEAPWGGRAPVGRETGAWSA